MFLLVLDLQGSGVTFPIADCSSVLMMILVNARMVLALEMERVPLQ